MSAQERLIATLTRPKSIRFRNNEAEVSAIKDQLSSLKSQTINGSTFWFVNNQPSVANTRVKIYPTGHIVFYGSQGRRFLFTDPEGHPLQECEWKKDKDSGNIRLVHARMQLDCGQWFGIKPGAKIFSTRLDLKSHPGWETITFDDLRKKAAEVWQVPLAEVEYFYKDDNFKIVGEGQYDIHLAKDGLYVLVDGTFDQTIFISYMPKLNWPRLDIIPTVELFQSAPPGAGGAAFELVWGLYDDQSRETQLEPLRFRGLPTYPSEKAFQIFSAFFSPTGPEGEDLLGVFMDYNSSYRILWDPVPNPPWRYFSDEYSACMTVQNHFLYKVTILDDPAALPFVNCSNGGRPSCQRQLQVKKDSILLIEGNDIFREIPLLHLWQISPPSETQTQIPTYPFNWRNFFKGYPPKVNPVRAVLTVPFYPEGSSEIEESSLQPMVVDQILFYMENFPSMATRLGKIDRVLIHNFDTVISGCVDCTHEREYKVLFSDAEFAQKNAQLLWDYAASRKQLETLRKVSFLPEKENVESAYKEKYGLIFRWIPFRYYQDKAAAKNILDSVVQVMNPHGLLFLVGMGGILELFPHYSLKCIFCDPVIEMPFFLQHKKMYPETQINPEITVFFAEKMV